MYHYEPSAAVRFTLLSERLTFQIRRTDKRCHGQTNDDTSIVIPVFDRRQRRRVWPGTRRVTHLRVVRLRRRRGRPRERGEGRLDTLPSLQLASCLVEGLPVSPCPPATVRVSPRQAALVRCRRRDHRPLASSSLCLRISVSPTGGQRRRQIRPPASALNNAPVYRSIATRPLYRYLTSRRNLPRNAPTALSVSPADSVDQPPSVLCRRSASQAGGGACASGRCYCSVGRTGDWPHTWRHR